MTLIPAELPIEEILKLLPQDELDALSAIGDSRDDQRWKIGDTARNWIDLQGFPVNQICKIIGKETDYGHERVRQFLYTSRFYAERPGLRSKYLNLRYSIFEYARQCDDPEAVLQGALENNLRPEQVKFQYPTMIDTIKELMSRIPRKYQKEAITILQTALAKIRELVER